MTDVAYEVGFWVLASWVVTGVEAGAFAYGRHLVRASALRGIKLYASIGGTAFANAFFVVVLLGHSEYKEALRWFSIVFFSLLGPTLIGARYQQKQLNEVAKKLMDASRRYKQE